VFHCATDCVVWRGSVSRVCGGRAQSTKADWVAWHLPGGPVGPPARWAATSNVKVGQTTNAVNMVRVGREGREGSEGQSHKGKEEVEQRRGPRDP